MLDPDDVAKALRNTPAFKQVAGDYNKKKYEEYPPNPYFLMNGFDGDASPKTKNNLKMRKIKGVGSKLFSFGGTVGAHFGSVVNTATITKHAVAEGSTILHGIKLNNMAKKVRDGGSLAAMLDQLIKVKVTKGAYRAGSLALTAIPDLGFIGSAAQGALTLAQWATFKATAALDLDLALRIHWQAYRELTLLRGNTGTGPALSIVSELLTRGVTGRFDFGDLHSETVNREIMREPAGYAVLLFKLQQG